MERGISSSLPGTRMSLMPTTLVKEPFPTSPGKSSLGLSEADDPGSGDRMDRSEMGSGAAGGLSDALRVKVEVGR